MIAIIQHLIITYPYWSELVTMSEENVIKLLFIVCTFVVLDAGQFLVSKTFGFLCRLNGKNPWDYPVKCYKKILPAFGVSTAILNLVDIFPRWCKLNFGLSGGHVEITPFHSNFIERVGTRRQYFYFLNVFLGITDKERHWTTILDTDLDLLLPFKRN